MEKLFFKNSQGLSICGILEELSKNDHIVILIHGSASDKNKTSSREMAEELTRRKINSFRIDLNGCGESEGDIYNQTLSGTINDTESAIQFMKDKGYKKIDLFGASAGGIPVIAAALKQDINKIGLKCPVMDFPSQRLRKRGKEYMDKWKKKGEATQVYYGKEIKVSYNFIVDAQNHIMFDKLKDIKCPVLIIHGTEDQDVLIDSSRKAVKLFPNAKLIEIPGANHKFTHHQKLINKLFGDWFEN